MGAEVQVDKLVLDIQVNDNLEKINKKLDTFQSSLSNLDTKGLQVKFDKLTNIVTPFLDKIKEVQVGLYSLYKLMGQVDKPTQKKPTNKTWTEQSYSIGKKNKEFLQMETINKKVGKSTEKLTKFFNEQGKVVGTLTKTVDEYGNVVTKATGTAVNNKSGKGGFGLFNFGKTLASFYVINRYARQLGRYMSTIVQRGIDYVETLNLWQVANRKNVEGAREFVREMNKAYGISEQSLMNYQAIFKNMLSSLGDLTDETSTKLSNALTQMALDFSSLYNVSFESAMQKYQAVLSGQVRPIRSVSGYDITENTIKEIYQNAGGERTIRQLNEIEKRLLRIVAVYGQMGETGAIGDLSKTIENSANQIRIMGELWKEMTTWIGISVNMLLQESGILTKINAGLIVMRELFKAIAYQNGYQEENFLEGMFENAENANDAVDELQGKLLSFDKFEALNSKNNNLISIDPTIQKLLGNIQVQTNFATNDAQELAEKWLKIVGLVDKNADGIYEITSKLQGTLETAKGLGIALGLVVSRLLIFRSWKSFGIGLLISQLTTLYFTNEDFRNSINSLAQSFQPVITAFSKFLQVISPVISFIGNLIAKFVTTLDKLGLLEPIVYAVAMALIALKVKSLISWFGELISKLGATSTQAKATAGTLNTKLLPALNKTQTSTLSLNKAMGALGAIVGGFTVGTMISDLVGIGTSASPLATILWGLVGAMLAVASAFVMVKESSKGGLFGFLAGATGVGIGLSMVVSSIKAIPKFATGGFPEDGLFFANSGEMVGKFSNGRTAVANNDQIVQGIQQGVYSAMMAYNAQTGGATNNGIGNVYLDGVKVGVATAKYSHNENVRTGLVKANR